MTVSILHPSLNFAGGQLNYTDNYSDLLQLVLHTLPGERPFYSDYGSLLHTLIQAPLPLDKDSTLMLLEFQEVLNKYLIIGGFTATATGYTIQVDPDQQRVLNTTIDYQPNLIVT